MRINLVKTFPEVPQGYVKAIMQNSSSVKNETVMALIFHDLKEYLNSSHYSDELADMEILEFELA